MEASVVRTVFVYLMLFRLALLSFAYGGIVTGVSLVGGSGPHEGTVQIAVSDDGSQLSLVTGHLFLLDWPRHTAICKTLGYPGTNRFFRETPFSTDEGLGFELICPDYTTVIGCRAYIIASDFHQAAVKCQTDGYLGCYIDNQAAHPLATSPCPPSPNSDYSCIDRDNMTTESCLEYCRMLNGRDVIITYAGVRAGIECTCGIDTTELGRLSDDIGCSSPCSGDRNYSNCGGRHYTAAFNITSEPDEQDVTTHALHPSPDPTNTTTTAGNTTTSAVSTTPAEADGDSCFCRSQGNAARNVGIGVGVGVVLLAVLAIMVNVYIYAQTRRQAAMYKMAPTAKLTTTATADRLTPSPKHDVYQPMTTPPTSDLSTGLDNPSQDQGNSYQTPIPPGGAHSGDSVVAMEMDPVYEVARPGSEEITMKTTDNLACLYVNSGYRGRKQEKAPEYCTVRECVGKAKSK